MNKLKHRTWKVLKLKTNTLFRICLTCNSIINSDTLYKTPLQFGRVIKIIKQYHAECWIGSEGTLCSVQIVYGTKTR